jgi:hypothetical protein
MTSIDEAIRKALSDEDARLLDRFGADLPLPQQLQDSFRGHLAWLNVLSWAAGFAIFGVGLYCGWRFLQAPDTAAMLRWAVGLLLCAMGLMLIKLFAWLELEKNAVVREVKRLELQVARLAAR